jgi:hypothetical protein
MPTTDPDAEDERVLYIVANAPEGHYGGDVAGRLHTADGEMLWVHVSSSPGFLRSDLTTGFTDRRETLAARYPGGYEVRWLGPDDARPWDTGTPEAPAATHEDGGRLARYADAFAAVTPCSCSAQRARAEAAEAEVERLREIAGSVDSSAAAWVESAERAIERAEAAERDLAVERAARARVEALAEWFERQENWRAWNVHGQIRRALADPDAQNGSGRPVTPAASTDTSEAADARP